MTWTYGGSPGTSTAAQRRDAVRSLTGDTVETADGTLSDEQIAFALSRYPALNMAAVYLAAADAAEQRAGAFSSSADLQMGKTRISNAAQAERFTTLAASLRQSARRGVNGFFPQGISVANNATAAADSDTVQPQSIVGRDAYPGTTPPLSTSTQQGV